MNVRLVNQIVMQTPLVITMLDIMNVSVDHRILAMELNAIMK